MLRLAVLLLGAFEGFGSELCLDDGVPESQRKYIQDDAGNDIPIGVFESNWASSWLLNKLTEMLLQEVMGYHAKAGRVREFVSNMNFELPEVQSLLLELQQSSTYNVSCKWMRENRARWLKWKPVETSCYEGFGLVDASGAFDYFFEKGRRRPSESIQDYISHRENEYEKLTGLTQGRTKLSTDLQAFFLLRNAGESSSQHRAILGQAGNEYDWDKIVGAMLIQLDGGDDISSKGWKGGFKSRQQSSYNTGGKRSSWAYPIEQEGSSYDGETDDVYAVDDWYYEEETAEEGIPVYDVEEDIQYDIEEMEHAVEMMAVDDLSPEELDIFAMTAQKMGKGGNVARYVSTASFFWIVTVALPTVGLLTNFIPILKRRSLAWEKNKTISTTGQFLQVGFTTMCNVGLMPFMCYRHPTNEQSILKYPNVFCGTAEHWIMRGFGALVIFLAFSFFIAACYAAYQAPRWSGKPRLAAIRFLIFRFRPNVWYFGLVLLARGPLLSMPGVIATNMPSLQLTLMHMILLGSLCLQLWFLPWKSPILNFVDGLSVSLLVMLLAGSLGYADSSGEDAARVLAIFGTVISSLMVVILAGMVTLGLCALCYRSALGSSKELPSTRKMSILGGPLLEENEARLWTEAELETFLASNGSRKPTDRAYANTSGPGRQAVQDLSENGEKKPPVNCGLLTKARLKLAEFKVEEATLEYLSYCKHRQQRSNFCTLPQIASCSPVPRVRAAPTVSHVSNGYAGEREPSLRNATPVTLVPKRGQEPVWRHWNLNFWKEACGLEYCNCRTRWPAFEQDDSGMDGICIEAGLVEYLEYMLVVEIQDAACMEDQALAFPRLQVGDFCPFVSSCSRFFKDHWHTWTPPGVEDLTHRWCEFYGSIFEQDPIHQRLESTGRSIGTRFWGPLNAS
eukprot:g22662.t1